MPQINKGISFERNYGTALVGSDTQTFGFIDSDDKVIRPPSAPKNKADVQ